MEPSFSVHLLIDTPSGTLPLSPERARLPLPQGLDAEQAPVLYGPYFDALTRFLSHDSYQPLHTALAQHTGKPVTPAEIQSLEIISRKHGAFYQVAQVRIHTCDATISLALNVAIRPDQQAVLETEFELLNRLHLRFGLPFIPRPYVRGESIYVGTRDSRQTLKLFLAEWFANYHEFHLSAKPGGTPPAVLVWDPARKNLYLDSQQTRSLYDKAAAILTSYFDGHSFEQIYPWHHAAGDFVVRLDGEDIDLRLITVRGYCRLFAGGADENDKWIAIAHFFLNLTIRMRLDRVDGTGDLAWAGAECVEGAVEGFLRAWALKARGESSMPACGEVLELLRGFSLPEWRDLAGIVLEDGLMEADEAPFLQSHLEEHLNTLMAVLKDLGDGM